MGSVVSVLACACFLVLLGLGGKLNEWDGMRCDEWAGLDGRSDDDGMEDGWWKSKLCAWLWHSGVFDCLDWDVWVLSMLASIDRCDLCLEWKAPGGDRVILYFYHLCKRSGRCQW